MKIFFVLFTLILASSLTDVDQTKLSDEEIQMILERHNYWRADVGVTTKLEWSEDMANLAADWARKLKNKDCGWEHRPDNDFGENLFKGTTGAFDAAYVVDAWASEKADYNYNRNKCKPGKMCGHYTQIVWKTTQKVGCAKITCDGMDIWVCNYDPPGNWVGEKPY
ncbi:CAP domain-containing protein [Ekhidna sp.]|uniref:CAP domain-containing protein n=1 Tax=Ekhidna sp. TaxID=2608089 RepID=UPI003B505064